MIGLTVVVGLSLGNFNFAIKENNMVRAKIFILEKYLYTITKAFGQRCIHHQFFIVPTNYYIVPNNFKLQLNRAT